MARKSALDDIRELTGPLVDALGLRLYDIEISGSGRSRTVRVLLDRDGGLDLDAITAATRAISTALDEANPIDGPYLLEVSSPGLERPLRLPEHFRAAVGETITVSHRHDTGSRRQRGLLVDAGARGCVLDIDGARHEIAYESVTKARTVFEWDSRRRPDGQRSGPSRARAKEKA